MFDFSNYFFKSKYCDSKSLVAAKMKDEMDSVSIANFVGLKPKMYLILVSNSREYKKAKIVNKNVVAKISRNEYKDALLNKRCFRHSMNRSKNHRIRIYEINKFSLSCFVYKIYVSDNGIDALGFGY